MKRILIILTMLLFCSTSYAELWGSGTASTLIVQDAGDVDATYYLGLWRAVDGALVGRTDTGITYNPSTNLFTIGGDITHSSATPADFMITSTDEDKDIVFSVNDGGFQVENILRLVGANSGLEIVGGDATGTLALSIAGSAAGNNAIQMGVEGTADEDECISIGPRVDADTVAGGLVIGYLNSGSPGEVAVRGQGAIVIGSAVGGGKSSFGSVLATDLGVLVAGWSGGGLTVATGQLHEASAPRAVVVGGNCEAKTEETMCFGNELVGDTVARSMLYGFDFTNSTASLGLGYGSKAIDITAALVDIHLATTIGDGTNKMQVSDTGVLTLAGTARVIKHLHFTMELGKGQNAPSERFAEDPYVSYTYGIGDDSHLSREGPDDMDYTVDSVIKVHWYTTDATADGVDEVRWAVQWASQAIGEDITAGDTTDNSGDIVCSAQNIIVETLVETVPANSIAANDMIGIHIERVALGDGTGPQAGTVHIIDVELEYTSNKLGE